MDAVNPTRSLRQAAQYSKRSLCCCLSKRMVCYLGQMQFLMFKHIREERLNTSQSRGFGSAQHWGSELMPRKEEEAVGSTRQSHSCGQAEAHSLSSTLTSPSQCHRDDRLDKNLLVLPRRINVHVIIYNLFGKVPDVFQICQLIHCLFGMKQEAHIRKTETRTGQRAWLLEHFLPKHEDLAHR